MLREAVEMFFKLPFVVFRGYNPSWKEESKLAIFTKSKAYSKVGG